MERERVSQELIKQARQADLAEYLIRQGEPLVKKGQRYRHKEHDSLVFTKNSYYWNSISESGNAIDFLQRHKGLDFMSAVFALTQTVAAADGERDTNPSSQIIEQFSFADIKLESDMRRTVAYLNKSRGISYSLIKKLIDEMLIYQETTTNNIIFPMYDETGGLVGAETSGTLSDKRFKGIKTGSKYGYGYTIKGKSKLEYALFFESAVDLLSFIEIEQIRKKPINNALLVSMAGLKDATVKQILKCFGSELQPVLCVDNDMAGAEFIKFVKSQVNSIKIFLPNKDYKDWNDQLKSMKGISR